MRIKKKYDFLIVSKESRNALKKIIVMSKIILINKTNFALKIEFSDLDDKFCKNVKNIMEKGKKVVDIAPKTTYFIPITDTIDGNSFIRISPKSEEFKWSEKIKMEPVFSKKDLKEFILLETQFFYLIYLF